MTRRLEGHRALVVAHPGGSEPLSSTVSPPGVPRWSGPRGSGQSTSKAPLSCDVRDPTSCKEVVRLAVERLGGLDGLVYAPGITVVTCLADGAPEHWRAVLATDLVGAGLVTAAAIEHLEASRGVAVERSIPRTGRRPSWTCWRAGARWEQVWVRPRTLLQRWE